MPEPRASTEVEPRPLAEGEASPPPIGLLFVVWLGALSVVVWTMTRLFVARRPSRDQAEP
jgi:4-hydroxybenzoate polyprenyltransferase